MSLDRPTPSATGAADPASIDVNVTLTSACRPPTSPTTIDILGHGLGLDGRPRRRYPHTSGGEAVMGRGRRR